MLSPVALLTKPVARGLRHSWRLALGLMVAAAAAPAAWSSATAADTAAADIDEIQPTALKSKAVR